MKKLLFLCVAVLCVGGGVFAQDVEERRGFIGITIGPAFPTGDIERSAISGGAQLNLVNFGYLFSQNVGIAATWFGTSFTAKYDSKTSIGLGGMMFGPLISFPSSSGMVEFDFKPMIGFGRGSMTFGGQTSTSESAIALGFGTAARWNCGRRISLSVGVDYYNCSPESIDLSSVAISFGINYRLK